MLLSVQEAPIKLISIHEKQLLKWCCCLEESILAIFTFFFRETLWRGAQSSFRIPPVFSGPISLIISNALVLALELALGISSGKKHLFLL